MIGRFLQFFEADLAEGLAWTETPSTVYQEKLDGVRALLDWGKLRGKVRAYHTPAAVPAPLLDCVLDGELVGDVVHVFDVLVWHGQEVSQWPLWRRMELLQQVEPLLADWMRLVPFHTANPLESILDGGGEGIVKKELGTPWGFGWVKCKRIQTEDCEIADLDPEKRSAGLRQGDVDCGRVFLGNLFTEAVVGGVVEVVAHSRHPSGKLREARAVRLRGDKIAEMCNRS